MPLIIRIGTWNLNAKWSAAHEFFLTSRQVDIWLLTEVSPKACVAQGRIAEYESHISPGSMSRGQHWAAILSASTLMPLAEPGPASVAACVEGITYCCSILPWPGCKTQPFPPWSGLSLEDMTRAATGLIVERLPSGKAVWGGDWNQNLSGGRQGAGSAGMRTSVESAVSAMGLEVVTRDLPHRQLGLKSVDHIAVPSHWTVGRAERISADGLSDHDAYVVDVEISEAA